MSVERGLHAILTLVLVLIATWALWNLITTGIRSIDDETIQLGAWASYIIFTIAGMIAAPAIIAFGNETSEVSIKSVAYGLISCYMGIFLTMISVPIIGGFLGTTTQASFITDTAGIGLGTFFYILFLIMILFVSPAIGMLAPQMYEKPVQAGIKKIKE